MEKTAIITGGGRGIGRACALALAEEGYNLVINYAGNEIAANETARQCEEAGGHVLLVKGDVSKEGFCDELVGEAVKAFGRVDVLVNSAGITRDNILMRMTEEDFDRVLEVNLKGTCMMMKAVSRQMMRQKYGRIVNMASVIGLMGNAGQVNYAASKAGVIGATKSLARELASKGVTINAVAPGFIETDMTAALDEAAAKNIAGKIPQARLGRPEDVANAVKFLASQQAGYITGQVLCVDGGMCM